MKGPGFLADDTQADLEIPENGADCDPNTSFLIDHFPILIQIQGGVVIEKL